MVLCRVTLVCLGVPNDSVESFALKGTTMKSVEARLCVTRSHIRVLIAETPPFDGRPLVFGVNAAPETQGSDVRFLR
mgnify:CR=1 FL=1